MKLILELKEFKLIYFILTLAVILMFLILQNTGYRSQLLNCVRDLATAYSEILCGQMPLTVILLSFLKENFAPQQTDTILKYIFLISHVLSVYIVYRLLSKISTTINLVQAIALIFIFLGIFIIDWLYDITYSLPILFLLLAIYYIYNGKEDFKTYFIIGIFSALAIAGKLLSAPIILAIILYYIFFKKNIKLPIIIISLIGSTMLLFLLSFENFITPPIIYQYEVFPFNFLGLLSMNLVFYTLLLFIIPLLNFKKDRNIIDFILLISYPFYLYLVARIETMYFFTFLAFFVIISTYRFLLDKRYSYKILAVGIFLFIFYFIPLTLGNKIIYEVRDVFNFWVYVLDDVKSGYVYDNLLLREAYLSGNLDNIDSPIGDFFDYINQDYLDEIFLEDLKEKNYEAMIFGPAHRQSTLFNKMNASGLFMNYALISFWASWDICTDCEKLGYIYVKQDINPERIKEKLELLLSENKGKVCKIKKTIASFAPLEKESESLENFKKDCGSDSEVSFDDATKASIHKQSNFLLSITKNIWFQISSLLILVLIFIKDILKKIIKIKSENSST